MPYGSANISCRYRILEDLQSQPPIALPKLPLCLMDLLLLWGFNGVWALLWLHHRRRAPLELSMRPPSHMATIL